MSIPLAYSEEKREVTPLTRTIRTALIVYACVRLAGQVSFWVQWIQDVIRRAIIPPGYVASHWTMTITNGIHSIALTVILIALICPHRIKHLFGLLALCATMMLVASLATNVGVYLFPGDLGRSMPINRIIIYILYPFGDVGSLLLVMMWFERRSKRSN